MNNFSYANPTKLIFGKGEIGKLSEEVVQYGTKVLLVYGGGSIKKNGVYDQVIKELNKISATIYELSGVEPNPRVTTVRQGVEICKEHGIDFILAVGGGSVIDCSKAIAVGAKLDVDVWEVMLKNVIPTEAVPLGTVLTIAATGSEMNPSSVITNWETNEKLGWGSPVVYPKFSILDPVFTYSLPENQTVYGIIDMMSHVLEAYFHLQKNTPLQDRFMEGILRTVIEAAPKVIENPTDYEIRETILYCGTMALNGMVSMGIQGDWASHRIEHAISAVYDIPHAAGLSIVFPHYLKYIASKDSKRILQLARNVFDIRTNELTVEESVAQCIDKLQTFWVGLGGPKTLSDVNISTDRFEEMAEKTVKFGSFGGYYSMNKEDVLEVLHLAR